MKEGRKRLLPAKSRVAFKSMIHQISGQIVVIAVSTLGLLVFEHEKRIERVLFFLSPVFLLIILGALGGKIGAIDVNFLDLAI